MKPLIQIISDGNPRHTEVTWIETGENIPVTGFTYNIQIDRPGFLLLEIPVRYIELNILNSRFMIDKIQNKLDELGAD